MCHAKITFNPVSISAKIANNRNVLDSLVSKKRVTQYITD